MVVADELTERTIKLNGLLLYFELTLGPITTFSTHPTQADSKNHWRSPVLLEANVGWDVLTVQKPQRTPLGATRFADICIMWLHRQSGRR